MDNFSPTPQIRMDLPAWWTRAANTAQRSIKRPPAVPLVDAPISPGPVDPGQVRMKSRGRATGIVRMTLRSC
jgi:hypothetical protein